MTLGGVSQAGFPVTSSPDRNSTTSRQPPLDPPNISDLTTSLHMQQFLQRLVSAVQIEKFRLIICKIKLLLSIYIQL